MREAYGVAIEFNKGVTVEPSSFATETHTSPDKGLHHAISHTAVPDEAVITVTVTTTKTTMPVAQKGWKCKGHRHGPTTTDAMGQGTGVKKRKGALP